MLDSYYVVFDQSSTTERNLQYNNIGFAPLNTTALDIVAIEQRDNSYVDRRVPNQPGQASKSIFDEDVVVWIIVSVSAILLTVIIMTIVYFKCRQKQDPRYKSMIDSYASSMTEDPNRLRIN